MNNFHDKIVYQIYPKSFADTNGDGIGDLPGVTAHLDYLADLGVDYLWLTPFFKSPQNDNGYDVADYYSIEPMFGTMKDLERLISEADRRGIGIMLDMVFNHTSTEHEWFKRALAGEKKYQDFYIFKEGAAGTPPTNWVSKFGGSAWEYVPALGQWYLHLFDRTQADLNWENPRVREELKKVIAFWKNMGVKGFRFDVVNLISKPETFSDDNEGDGRRFYTDGRHVHDFLHELVHDTGIADMVTVGEMSSTSLENCIRYSNPADEELSMTFSFHHLKVDYKDGDKWALQAPDFTALKKLFEKWQMGMQEGDGWNALFWCNHDQPRVVSRFGDDKKYWRESAKMLATAIHLMRGTPYIYEGEELGMTNAYFDSVDEYRDVESLNYYRILTESGKTPEEALEILAARSRDNGRTPMQWTKEKNAGFCEKDIKPWIGIPSYKPEANAEAEEEDPGSILSWYRKLIAFRKGETLVSEGKIDFLLQENAKVLAYRRYAENKEGGLYIFCNLTGEAEQIPLEGISGLKTNAVHEVCLDNYSRETYETGLSDSYLLKPYQCLVLRTK